MPFAVTRMKVETLILSEVSQKEKDKYHIISLISGIYCANQPFHRKETHEVERQTYGCQGRGRGVGWSGRLELIDTNYCI